ncbi:MAG: ABC transporter permease [Vicinamibacterales bacterium]
METSSSPFTERIAQDIRHAARRLRRDWPFTLAAAVILGLGVGVNTAVFSIVNTVLLTPRHVPGADRLVDLYQRGSNPGGLDANSYPAYLDMAAYGDVFASVTAASVPLGVQYRDGGSLRPAVVEYATASYPEVLRLRPAVGRWFDATEDQPGTGVVAVVGHRAWMRRFGADPGVVGRTIRMEGQPVTIVGVGPAGYDATTAVGIVTDFWLPVSAIARLSEMSGVLDRKPGEAPFFVKARLRDGVTIAQAQAAMDGLGSRLAAEHPTEDPGQGIRVVASTGVRIHPQLDGTLSATAIVLLVIVGLVLATACSNVATLLLIRGAARQKELAIRRAVGASRGQLIRHLLVEAVCLSGLGGLAGVVVAWWSIRAIRLIEMPVDVEVALDVRVLAFAVALSVLTGVLVGLVPALRSTRVDVLPGLRADTVPPGRGRLSLRHALVVFQVAASVLFLGARASSCRC